MREKTNEQLFISGNGFSRNTNFGIRFILVIIDARGSQWIRLLLVAIVTQCVTP